MPSQMRGEMLPQLHSKYPRGNRSQFPGEIRTDYPSEMLREMIFGMREE